MEDKIIIYSDGACLKNPGPGGWGTLIIKNGKHFEYGGHVEETTNNIMELTAALEGLKRVQNDDQPVVIYTDSQYLKKGITQWVHIWKINGWQTAKKEDVKNKELWIELDRLNEPRIRWEWVKGHADNEFNNRVDTIAQSFARNEPVELSHGSLSLETGRKKPRPKKVYLSLIGRQLARHSSWDKCQARVNQISNAKYKACKTYEEEIATVREWGLPGKVLEELEIDSDEPVSVKEQVMEKRSILVGLPFISKFMDTLEKKGFARKETQKGEALLQGDDIQIVLNREGLFDFFGIIKDQTEDLLNRMRQAEDKYTQMNMRNNITRFPDKFELWRNVNFLLLLHGFQNNDSWILTET
ncbi:MAG: ribonuclease HI, partial [Vulcanimicrobiota bacterium]